MSDLIIQLSDNQTDHSTFLSTLMKTINNNRHRSPNNFKYPGQVLKFATSLYILAGRYTYNYVRMNLTYALPSIQTIEHSWSTRDYREAHFALTNVQIISNQCNPNISLFQKIVRVSFLN